MDMMGCDGRTSQPIGSSGRISAYCARVRMPLPWFDFTQRMEILMRSRLLKCAVLALCVMGSALASAQSGIQYFYDELGRLIAVVDPSGDTATYTYDAVGN